ncbi:MAG TPA: hypothetical protein VJH03_15720 [Blastocatellia bacterium]|nr:hypothetical protein [Blastocatellia bacterium]
MSTILVNPMDETVRARHVAAAKLDSLAGKTIALLDISKPGGAVFLDRLELLLKERHGVKRVIRQTKPTFTKPAPDEMISGIVSAGAEAVVEALAD